MANQPYDLNRADPRGSAAGRAEAYDADATGATNPDLVPDARGDARDRSLGSLLKELRDESTTLMRQEVALAKTEMAEKAGTYARNAASVAVGAAVLYAGVWILLLGLTCALYFILVRLGLSNLWSGVLAFAIVGGGLALVGYVLMQKGISTLKNESPVPEKTIQSLKEDKQWLTNQTK